MEKSQNKSGKGLEMCIQDFVETLNTIIGCIANKYFTVCLL